MRRRGVRPSVAKRTEPSSGFRYRIERVQEIARLAREPIEARHQQSVALAQGFEGARQFATICIDPAGRLAEHFRGPRGLQRRDLRVEGLPVRTDPC
jgi:hypothetical protein